MLAPALISALLIVLSAIPTELIKISLSKAASGKFEAFSEHSHGNGDSAKLDVMSITLVNNSDSVIVAHRVDFEIKAEGDLAEGSAQVAKLVTSGEYDVHLPDVSLEQPEKFYYIIAHSVESGKTDKIEFTLYRNPLTSVTGTYLIRASLITTGGVIDLKPVEIPVTSTRVPVSR